MGEVLVRSLAAALVVAGALGAGCTNGSASSPTAPSSSASPPGPAPGAQVEIEGTISGLAGACPNLTFTLGGIRIRTNVATEFERVSCASLANGVSVEVEGAAQPDGVLLAREVELEEVKLRGTIGASISGICPLLMFTVNDQRVLTLPTTRFDDITCAALEPSLPVEVRGFRRLDGLLLATRVRPLERRGRAVS